MTTERGGTLWIEQHTYSWDDPAIRISEVEVTLPFGSAMPDGAWVLGWKVETTEAFTDGVAGAFTLSLGPDGGAAWADAESLATVALAQGLELDATPALQLEVLLEGDVDLDTLTAGRVVVTVLFVIPALYPE